MLLIEQAKEDEEAHLVLLDFAEETGISLRKRKISRSLIRGSWPRSRSGFESRTESNT